MRQTSRTNIIARDENDNDLSNANFPTIEFFDFDASGNKRFAVGHFEIEVTLPLFKFVSENNSRPENDNFRYPIAGVLAKLDTQATTAINNSAVTSFVLGSPNKRNNLINVREMITGDSNTTQLKFTLTGNWRFK